MEYSLFPAAELSGAADSSHMLGPCIPFNGRGFVHPILTPATPEAPVGALLNKGRLMES